MFEAKSQEYWDTTYPHKRFRIRESTTDTTYKYQVIDTALQQTVVEVEGSRCRQVATFLSEKLNEDVCALDKSSYDEKPNGEVVLRQVASVRNALERMRLCELQYKNTITCFNPTTCASNNSEKQYRQTQLELLSVVSDIAKAELFLADMFPFEEMAKFAEYCQQKYPQPKF